MRRVILCAILVLTPTACTHATSVRLHSPSDPGLEAITRRAGGTSRIPSEGGPDAAVSLREDGQGSVPLVPARSLVFALDTSSWYNAETQMLERTSTAGIREVRFTNRTRGAFEGLGLGVLAGGALGALLLMGQDGDCQGDGSCFRFSRGDMGWIGAVLGGAAGGLIGGVRRGKREQRGIPV